MTEKLYDYQGNIFRKDNSVWSKIQNLLLPIVYSPLNKINRVMGRVDRKIKGMVVDDIKSMDEAVAKGEDPGSVLAKRYGIY